VERTMPGTAQVPGARPRGWLRDPAAVAALQGSMARTADWLRAICEAERAAGPACVRLLRCLPGRRAAAGRWAPREPAGRGRRRVAGQAWRRMPGTDIPIIAPDELVAAWPDVVLLFVSDLATEVRAALPQIEAGGGRWVDAGAGR
jgi:C-methyltransferase-like protein